MVPADGQRVSEKTGITVAMTRKSAGEIYARSRPKQPTPKAMFGGVARAIRICRPQKKTNRRL